jgi:TetR/AcrR family transcriptional regulator, regulator of cefoperazone and chloramphenicol sensitivity
MQTDDPRQRILDAAGEVFAEKGFKGATVRDIKDRAGVNLAAVNYYFGDKERLYIETVKHAHHICQQQVPMPTWAPGTPPARKLRDFIRTFLNRVTVDREPDWCIRLVMRELFQPTEACVVFVEEFVRPTFGMLQGILAELLPADTPEVKRRLIGQSIIGQCLHYRLTRPVITRLVGEEEFRSYDVDLLTDHITTFTLRALGVAEEVRR